MCLIDSWQISQISYINNINMVAMRYFWGGSDTSAI
jgi:hypothetical protein